MPVRILYADRDRWQYVGYAQRFRNDIPSADLVVPQADHFVMEDTPQHATREIGDFLSVPSSL